MVLACASLRLPREGGGNPRFAGGAGEDGKRNSAVVCLCRRANMLHDISSRAVQEGRPDDPPEGGSGAAGRTIAPTRGQQRSIEKVPANVGLWEGHWTLLDVGKWPATPPGGLCPRSAEQRFADVCSARFDCSQRVESAAERTLWRHAVSLQSTVRDVAQLRRDRSRRYLAEVLRPWRCSTNPKG